MIDGLYPSQFACVEARKSSHYRNLKHILNSSSSKKMTWFSPDFKDMSQRKKTNHQNWVTFNKFQKEQEKSKKNAGIYQKLRHISSTKSPYAFKTEVSPNKDRLLHHNYLYECDRRYEKIEQNNKLIASRLTSAKGDISHKKQRVQYQINKLNVTRLEKFDRFKRLNRVVTKLMREKFMNTSMKSYSQSNPEYR